MQDCLWNAITICIQNENYNSIKSGWETAGAAVVICPSLSNMPLIDPFNDMDPILQPFVYAQTNTISLQLLNLPLTKFSRLLRR